MMARRPSDQHNSTPSSPRFLPVGDTALSVEFGNTIDPDLNDRVVAFDQAVKATGLPAAILTGCLAASASPCELGLDVGRRF